MGQFRRAVAAVACAAALIAACGGGSLTLGEYAERGAELMAQLNTRQARLEAERAAAGPSIETERIFLRGRVEARAEFLAGLEDLGDDGPPEEAVALHAAAVDISRRLLSTEEALMVLAEEVDSPEEIWSSQEVARFNDADREAIALCKAVQAQFDATIERQRFGEIPWIPDDMKEVVRVGLGCPD